MGELVRAEDCFACRRILNDFYRDLDTLAEKVKDDPHLRTRLEDLRPPESASVHIAACNRCFDHERGLIRKHHNKWNS